MCMIENAKTFIPTYVGTPTPSSILDLASRKKKCNSITNLLTRPDLYSISEAFEKGKHVSKMNLKKDIFPGHNILTFCKIQGVLGQPQPLPRSACQQGASANMETSSNGRPCVTFGMRMTSNWLFSSCVFGPKKARPTGFSRISDLSDASSNFPRNRKKKCLVHHVMQL